MNVTKSQKVMLLAATFAALMSIAVVLPAGAQDYPSRVVKIIVPFPPGGNPDLAARLVAQRMSVDFGQSVIVENKPGANGSIGASDVAKARPDGYTLLVANLGILGINPGVYEKLPYDVKRDFVPIGRLAISPLLLVANSSLNLNSVQEMIAAAKKAPGKLSYASAGVGSAAHMAAALFGQMTGVDMLHVPFKGAGEASPAVAGGVVSVVFGGQGASWALVASGKVKALGLTGMKRSPMHPDVPTIAESGVPGYDISDWVGMLAPNGTPEPIIAKLSAEVGEALADPDLQKKFVLQGLEPAQQNATEFTSFIEAQQKKWAAVAQKAHIRVSR